MNDLASLPEVLTVVEVARYLRVNRQTVVNNLIGLGKLRAHKVGFQWRVLRKDLASYLLAEAQVPALRDPGGKGPKESAA